MIDELEKRKFQRLVTPLEVTVDIVSAQDVPNGPPQLRVTSRNISRGGICLETKSIEVGGINLLSGLPFARDNRLRLAVKLSAEEPPLVATGEVRWYDIARDVPGFLYRLGVAFTEIEDGGKDRLAGFLKKHNHDRGYIRKLLHREKDQ